MANQFSFKKGWNKLTLSAAKDVRQKIMNALGLQISTSFYPRLNGAIEPKVSEAKAIEDIFKEYGITDIWGEE